MRNHYIPQFLLRPWANSTVDGKVEVFRLDLPEVKSSRLTPRHTGYEDDLYALSRPLVAGMEQHAIEKHFLRLVDNCGARVRFKLETEGLRTLTPQDREDWARFLMSLRLRQPDLFDLLRKESASRLRAVLATQPEQYEELAGIDDPPSFEEWVETHFPGLIENFGLSFFHELVDNANIGTKILQMKWWLWDFKRDLLIADHPCIFSSGIDHPNLVIALPIAPRKVFMATQSDRVAQAMRLQDSRELAVRVDEASVLQARVRIYARDKQSERFIRNRKYKRRR